MYYDFAMSQDNYRPDEKDIRYILTEDNVPYEIGPGHARHMTSDTTLSDEERMCELTFILSGAIDVTKEEAESRAETLREEVFRGEQSD